MVVVNKIILPNLTKLFSTQSNEERSLMELPNSYFWFLFFQVLFQVWNRVMSFFVCVWKIFSSSCLCREFLDSRILHQYRQYFSCNFFFTRLAVSVLVLLSNVVLVKLPMFQRPKNVTINFSSRVWCSRPVKFIIFVGVIQLDTVQWIRECWKVRREVYRKSNFLFVNSSKEEGHNAIAWGFFFFSSVPGFIIILLVTHSKLMKSDFINLQVLGVFLAVFEKANKNCPRIKLSI